MRALTLKIAFALTAAIGFSQTLPASTESATTHVVLQSTRTVSEIAEYVEEVDRRLQKGRYDVVEEERRKWLIEQIADLRMALQAADATLAPSAALAGLASEFETGMVGIEEGGIVCRVERKTGTRMATQRCFTRQRLEEDTRRSQDQLRMMPRPQMPVAPGPQ